MVEEKVEVQEAKSKKETLVDEANRAAERLEKANLVAKELLTQKEDLLVREKLGGRSSYIKEEKQKTEDEKLEDEINAMFKGTGLNPLKK